MLAVAIDAEASALKDPKTAATLLNEIGLRSPCAGAIETLSFLNLER